jgi:hypothetical protein
LDFEFLFRFRKNKFVQILKKKKGKVLMGRPVWELPACGACFRAAEGGGEERPEGPPTIARYGHALRVLCFTIY